MATKDDMILEKLGLIQNDISSIKQDVVYLKTRDDQYRTERPEDLARLKELEAKVATNEQNLIKVQMTQEASNKFFREHIKNDEKSLKRIEDCVSGIKTSLEKVSDVELPEVQKELVSLRTKATIWGSIAGAIISFVFAIIVKMAGLFSSSQ